MISKKAGGDTPKESTAAASSSTSKSKSSSKDTKSKGGVTTKTKEKSKALASKKAVMRAAPGKVKKKIRTTTTFRRPKTLHTPRKPRYFRRSINRTPRLDQYKILKHPLNTESAMKKIEDTNTLVFIVDTQANKRQVKDAVKKLYDVDASKVNTLIRPNGTKKAYVRLTADVDALDIANKIGFI
ncbi:5868_t:CDS:2 [Diversispora eburnea]|uniref:5868_t:CDS:1 n=1 Tax=Diversispora eburnea TaxID=1213867 RepID=A0A9N8YQS2_9GLOM|nr:5868_t:CDS:2 [Diversispora eburnea]